MQHTAIHDSLHVPGCGLAGWFSLAVVPSGSLVDPVAGGLYSLEVREVTAHPAQLAAVPDVDNIMRQ